MSGQPKEKVFSDLLQRDQEVRENIAAFYAKDVFHLMSEMANLVNAGGVLKMLDVRIGDYRIGNQVELSLGYMVAPLARLANVEPKKVQRDILTMAAARRAQ